LYCIFVISAEHKHEICFVFFFTSQVEKSLIWTTVNVGVTSWCKNMPFSHLCLRKVISVYVDNIWHSISKCRSKEQLASFQAEECDCGCNVTKSRYRHNRSGL